MLYNILKISNETDDKLIAEFNLDPKDPVFKGHFPQQPILPGVVMVQIQRDILQKHLNISIGLQSASNIKYLLLIIPVENKILTFNIRFKYLSQDQISVTSELIQDGSISMKFSGIYKIK